MIPYLHVEALQAETATAINEVCQACAVELGEPVLAIQSYVAKLKKKAALAVMEGLCCVASELPCVHTVLACGNACVRASTHTAPGLCADTTVVWRPSSDLRCRW